MSAIAYTYNVAPNPSDTQAGGLPVGTIVQYAAVPAPSGWLNCDGSAISRTTYAALFSVIGTTYGAGDTVSTFNIPDTRARQIRGVGTSGIGLGGTGGADSVTLLIGNIPPHSHGVQQNGSLFTGGGTISSLQPNPSAVGNYVDGAIRQPNSTTIVTTAVQSPAAVTIVNPFINITSIIKYA
jgi:microcystin-dependent protein